MSKQRINAGQMTEKIKRYVFSDGILTEGRPLRAKWERKGKRCVFSRHGKGSDSTEYLTFYTRGGLKAKEMIKIRGQWYIPSFVAECNDNNLYSYALCGRCEVKRCRATSLLVEFIDELNRPENERGHERIFDAVMCERYISLEDNGHFGESTAEFILIFPKNISLGLADIVEIDSKDYNVNRLSDGEIWQEAVISRRDDV